LKNKLTLIIICLVLLPFGKDIFALAKFDKQFSENMVLPEGKKSRIFGTENPNELIQVGYRGEIYYSTSDKNGQWELYLNNGTAGGPFEITLYGGNAIVINGVHVGIVFLVNGNTEPMVQKGKFSFSADELKNISFFAPEKRYSGLPMKNSVSASGWKKAFNGIQKLFPAYLAKALWQKYKMPVGIIYTTDDEAPADAYMPGPALDYYAPNPQTWLEVKDLKIEGNEYENYRSAELTQLFRGWCKMQIAKKKTGFFTPESFKTAETNFLKWEPIFYPNLNVTNEDRVTLQNGIYYLHRFIQLPTVPRGNDSLYVVLGKLYDQDSVFINGKFLGSNTRTGAMRRYAIHEREIPNKSVRILIKLTNFGKTLGGASLLADSCIIEYAIFRSEFISIAGDWLYTKTLSFDTLAPPNVLLVADRPSVVYNRQVFPFASFSPHGIVQGIGEGKGNDWRILKGVNEALRKDFPNAAIFSWYNQKEGTEALTNLFSLPNEIQPLTTYDFLVYHPSTLADRIVLSYKLNREEPSPFPELEKVKQKKNHLTFSFNKPVYLIPKSGAQTFVVTNTEGNSIATSQFTLKNNKITLELPKGWKAKSVSYQIENYSTGNSLISKEGTPLKPFQFNFAP